MITPPVVVQWTDLPNGSKRCAIRFGHFEGELFVEGGRVILGPRAFDWNEADILWELVAAAFESAGCDPPGMQLVRQAIITALGAPPQDWVADWPDTAVYPLPSDPEIKAWFRKRPITATMLALEFPSMCLVRTKTGPVQYAVPGQGLCGYVDDYTPPDPKLPRGGLVVIPYPGVRTICGLCDPDRMEVVGFRGGLTPRVLADLVCTGKA